MEKELLIKNGFLLKNDEYFKSYGHFIIFIEEKENNFKLTLNEYWGDALFFNDVDINFILKLDNFLDLSCNEVSEYIDDHYIITIQKINNNYFMFIEKLDKNLLELFCKLIYK